jgi:hypothetical protein
VGWRDRDWARFNNDEWRAFTSAAPPTAPQARKRSSVSGKGLSQAAVVSVAVLAAAAVGLHKYVPTSSNGGVVTHVGLPLSGVLKAPTHTRTVVVKPPADVIGIHWRTQDLAPAATAGRVCVTSAAHGRICASYAIGEKPADTLTRRLASLGLKVQSSG